MVIQTRSRPAALRDLFGTDSRAWQSGAWSADARSIARVVREIRRSFQERAEGFLAQELPKLPNPACCLDDPSAQPFSDSWTLKNPRRLFLIDKKFHSREGLSLAEEEELRQLQAAFESYLDSIRPLPEEMLADLEALADQLEARDDPL
jgi:hypothetical protein